MKYLELCNIENTKYLNLIIFLTLQMPLMHMSLVPTLHGVPSITDSPHGTITVSSVSVQ
jgi:hypothetical protein